LESEGSATAAGQGAIRATRRAFVVFVTLLVTIAVVEWKVAGASGRRSLPDGCTVEQGASGPDRHRGFAPGAEGAAPDGWTEASTRPFDWDGDGKADSLNIDHRTGTVTVRWVQGEVAIEGVSIPAAAVTTDAGGASADGEPAPRPAEVADVTGDGWPDLMVVSHGEARVLVGSGSGHDIRSRVRFTDIGVDVQGWVSPPVPGPDGGQIPYDNVSVRPLWDLDEDGADDFSVVSGARRTAGPVARYRGRPCVGLGAADRLSHRPGMPDPGAIAGDGRPVGRNAGTAPSSTGVTVTGIPTWTTPTTTPGPPKTGRASVLTVDAADPSVLRQGNHYWAYTTNSLTSSGGYRNVPVHHSTTLWFWDSVAEALPNVGTWSDANHNGKVWAPTVQAFGSTYVLYYTARVRSGLAGAGRQCIGRATSVSPAGPFTDSFAAPIMCLSSLGGSIDPDVFVDGNGTPWLLSKNDGNCCGMPSGLWAVQLTSDGLNITGGGHLLSAVDRGWEQPTIENPSMVTAGAKNWLFYSGNDWTTASYASGYASCSAATGPCSKAPSGTPWLSTTSYAKGAGGADLFQDAKGGWWMTYHGWLDQVGYSNGGTRALFVDKVDFDSGQPVINSSYPFEQILLPPPQVTGLHVEQSGHNAAVIRWDEPGDDTVIQNYAIDVEEVGVADPQVGCGWGAAHGATEALITCVRDGHTYDLTVLATNAAGSSPRSEPVRLTMLDSGSRFVGVTPIRVLDTRDGTGVARAGRVGPGETVALSLAGRAGLPVAGQVNAVALNLTVTNPSRTSHLRVYPGNASTPPESSSLNFSAEDTIASMVTAQVAPDGTVKIFNNSGQTHVIADLVGYYSAPTDATGALHRALPPARVLDTRDGQGLPSGAARVGSQQSLTLSLADRGGLPAAGEFSSVILNVTAVGGSKISHLRVYPGDQAEPPFASSLNFDAGQTIANLVTVRAGADGTVKVYNQNGDVDIVADVVGYYGPLGGTVGAKFYAVAPQRIVDTRWWPPESGMSPLPAGSPLALWMYHPSLGFDEEMSSAVMTVTVDQPSAPSHLTVWPDQETMPTVSNLNFVAGQVIANQVSVQLSDSSPDPQWRSFGARAQNNAGTVHVIADLNGWFGPEA